MSPIALELGLGALMLVVFFAGMFGRRDDSRRVGVIAAESDCGARTIVSAELSWRRPCQVRLEGTTA